MNSKLDYLSMTNCSGDWFQISIECREGKTRCVMSRVIGWAHRRFNGQDFFDGIDCNGHPHVLEGLDYVYVNGQDISPIGKRWIDVFNETPSFNWGLKEIPNFISNAELNPERFSIMPIVIESYERNRKVDCDFASGHFTRSIEFTFEVYFADGHTEDTYKNTRIAEMYIKSGEVIQWSWGGPPLDKEPEWEFGKKLLADLLTGLQSVANRTPIDHLKEGKGE